MHEKFKIYHICYFWRKKNSKYFEKLNIFVEVKVVVFKWCNRLLRVMMYSSLVALISLGSYNQHINENQTTCILLYRNDCQGILNMIVFAHQKSYDLAVKISCASTGLFIWIRWRMNAVSKYDHASASKNHHFPYMLRFHLLEFIFFTSNISSQQGWILIMVSSWQGINTFKVRPSSTTKI